MNIIKLSTHFVQNLLIKNELPSGRTLMATLGDDGDIKNIYMYTMKIIHNCQHFLSFLHNKLIFFLF